MGIKIGNTDISKIKIASGLTPRLPSAYQEVEYIQSSGTQYIDTGWTPSSNYCKTVMDATIYTGNSGYSVYYGMTNGSKAYSLHTDHSTRQLNVGSVVNRNTGISFSNGTNGTFTFEANNGSISVDIAGSTYTGSYSGSVAQTSRNMYIFAFNENGSVTRKVNMKLGELKIYSDADTLVRDFIPCYRIADGVIGLYDFVNDVFYTNAGSGTFSKGADINLPYKEIKKVYLGSTQIRPSNTYSYDFMDKSISTIENDGWAFSDSSFANTSNGLHRTTGDGSITLSNLGIDFSNATSIVITSDVYIVSAPWGGYMTEGTDKISMGLRSNNNSGYNGYGIHVPSGVNYTNTNLNGQYSATLTVDLVNGTAQLDLTGGLTKTVSLSASDISQIKNSSGFSAGFSGNKTYIQNVSITVN